MFCLSVYLSVWIQLIDSHSLPFTAGYFPFQLPFILNFIPVPKLGGSVALMLDSSRRAWVQIAAATLSGNMFRQTVHTNCASVHRGPFCAWVQHANHSATELLQTNKKTRKIIFFNAIPKTFKDVKFTLRVNAFQTLITLSTTFVCCGGVVFCVSAGGGSAMRGSRDRRHDDAYATESSQNLRRMIFTAYTRRPYTCEIIPVISQYETVITGINCMYFFVTAVVYTVQSITGFLYG